MSDSPSPAVSIVIPAYNEEDRILRALSPTLAYLSGLGVPAELMVVSDGSQDRTVAVVNEHAPKEGNVTVRALEYHPNRGKGYAVQYGMTRAEGERILFMDADYAVPVEDMDRAMALLDQGFDIAMGSRSVRGSEVRTRQNLPRMLSARLYTLVQNLYLGLNYPDTQCGFKMFTKKAARDLFPRQKLASVIFDAEILWLAKKRGYRVGQFPVTWTHIEDSRIQYDSLKKSLFVFQELFRIRPLHRS